MTTMRRSHRQGIATAMLLAVSFIAHANEPTKPRQAELMNLLTQDCGSCHGLKMTGGLGPALTPTALAGKSAVMLREVILHGRPGTPMPPWKPFLTADEADWLVKQLLTGESMYATH